MQNKFVPSYETNCMFYNAGHLKKKKKEHASIITLSWSLDF